MVETTSEVRATAFKCAVRVMFDSSPDRLYTYYYFGKPEDHKDITDAVVMSTRNSELQVVAVHSILDWDLADRALDETKPVVALLNRHWYQQEVDRVLQKENIMARIKARAAVVRKYKELDALADLDPELAELLQKHKDI